MYYPTGKRILDVTAALAAVAVGAIPMAVIAVVIRIIMGRPVLFRMVRPGWHAKPFVLYKFRTMGETFDAMGNPLPDALRVTGLGRFLRRTSLDELPQLVNVLIGDMSLVGPRPLKMEYLPLYTRHQARRHDVRPGITGLAQISGRNRLPWDERFRLDVEYVDNISFLRDLRILVDTVAQVVARHNVSPGGDVDVPLFTGSTDRSS
jgi:lipopolysaccharide/colanic/teichoic acid biosynthesis glycosyltransferase